MTEEQWLNGGDPSLLVYFLCQQQRANRTNAGKRRLRLFACACMRRRWDLIKEPSVREVVALCERYADGQATADELTAAQERVERWWQQQRQVTVHSCIGSAAWVMCTPGMARMWPQHVAYQMSYARGIVAAGPPEPGWNYELVRQAQCAEMRGQADLARDIFGNPFRPLPRRTFSADLRSLAQGCYEGDASLYPILADALADAGEEAAAAHCRQGGHARGCHVVDWVRS
jgi:hypothetical protein